MLPHSQMNIIIHGPHGGPITSLVEVVVPAFYLSVKLRNHFVDGASVPAPRGQLFDSLAFPFTRFGARHHRQERWFVSIAAFLISKGVAKEVEARPPLFYIYDSRLCPVDFKSHPLFRGLVYPVADSCSHTMLRLSTSKAKAIDSRTGPKSKRRSTKRNNSANQVNTKLRVFICPLAAGFEPPGDITPRSRTGAFIHLFPVRAGFTIPERLAAPALV